MLSFLFFPGTDRDGLDDDGDGQRADDHPDLPERDDRLFQRQLHSQVSNLPP